MLAAATTFTVGRAASGTHTARADAPPAARAPASTPAAPEREQALAVASLIEGKPVATLTHTEKPPMTMPSDVAVASDGKVYVADGVNNRVIWFDNAGRFAGEIKAETSGGLLRPMSVRIDSRGRLWIADTGHGRVVLCTPSDSSEQIIAPKQDGGTQGTPDITDVAVTPDGKTAWLVDNNGGRLLRTDMATGRTESVGKPGDGLGQFQYPFMIDLAPGGEIFVTDVINGRVQVLNPAGQPLRAISRYGIEPGELYRPGGIALDADGRVWVSDGVLGVVQVFSAAGTFLGVLGQAGRPIRFEIPIGLAFDRRGDLYVLELGANRVRRWQVTVHPGPPPPAAPVAGLTVPQQPRTCTSCHLEWVYPLSAGKRTLFVTSFENPLQYPHVSRPETCLSCHDGVAADSRQAVWYEHSHPVGIAAPKQMQTAGLPLVSGEMVCRTCHVAHRRPGPANIATAVYIRMKNDPAELCASCHSEFDRGPAEGMHPLGNMTLSVPDLLRAHPKQPAGQHITCLVCHRPHGARRDLLLALPGETNQLCLSCHQELRPEQFSVQHLTRHGQRPRLSENQRAVATGFGTELGDNNTLICLTCHQAHRATSSRFLLAFHLAGVGSCAGCHADQAPVVNSSHDLRTNHPHVANDLGLTPDQAGPCSGCHGAHRYARQPAPTDLDKKGWCITCHRPEHVAADKQLGSVNHPPDASCPNCHNPHTPRGGQFLAAQASAICHECHQDLFSLLGGPHDVKRASAAWPEKAVETSDLCLACHRLHGTEQTGLFRMGLAAQGPRADAACLPCHAPAAPGADTQQALIHPGLVTTLPAPTTLPVASGDDQTMIACNTCHAPHRSAGGGGPAAVLLRITEGGGQALCLDCHRQMVGINSIGHAAPLLRAAGFQTAGCQPCHTVHNNPAQVHDRYLYPESLLAQAKVSPLDFIADRYCVSCHRQGGPAPMPQVASHPVVPVFNLAKPGQPGFLPLFDAQGHPAQNGNMSCRTCHVTHGRTEPAELGEEVGYMPLRELQARQWHLRNFGPGSFCANCHGASALYRFLYFHDPQRRAATIEGGLISPGESGQR